MSLVRHGAAWALIVFAGLALSAWGKGEAGASSAATNVAASASSAGTTAAPASNHNTSGATDNAAITANKATSHDWPQYGLNNANTRFSTLDQIDAGNVEKLGLVWTYKLGTVHHGVETDAAVVDGVMYVTEPWSIVDALDARTGKLLWTFDPKVPRTIGYKGCCDVVNRGVAVSKDKVYFASYDGRLFALDATTGKKIWSVDTIEDHSHSYTVTGAPIVIHDKVIIGNGGAEYGVRGYVTAYDSNTGKKDWRWYTVPGDPSKPYDNGDGSLKMAAQTWDPSGKYWINGGGGTVWDSMAYDPDLNLLYLGTGNGSPWNAKLRSPAGGDNLFLASVVALNPDTGKYVWHYQETPGDNSDYVSTQDIILADLEIDGEKRKVLIHAPKNGFFFVIDRTNGKFISAENYVPVNWANGYDENGRPMETKAFHPGKAHDAIPGPYGAHNWQAMSYNPETGLAYIPAQNVPLTLKPDPNWERGEKNSGEIGATLGWNTGFFVNAVSPTSVPFGRLIAWDPIKQKKVWTQQYASPWNGGTLTTAGGLVFQGTADGRLIAFDASTGKTLWHVNIGQGAVAAPSTYTIDGKQYVSIAVGWGGAGGLVLRATDHQGPSRVYTFALGGAATMPDFEKYPMEPLVSGIKYDPNDVPEGAKIYASSCAQCHGAPGVGGGGAIPNLAHVGKGVIENLDRFVFNGPFVHFGMPDFTGKLTTDDVTKIKAFIQATADAAAKEQPEKE